MHSARSEEKASARIKAETLGSRHHALKAYEGAPPPASQRSHASDEQNKTRILRSSRSEGAIPSVRSTHQRDFRQSNGDYAIHVLNPEMLDTALMQRAAGLDRVENAYHAHGHAYPRFDRQKIRAYQQDNLVSGKVEPAHHILKEIPNMYKGGTLMRSARSNKVTTPAQSAGRTRSAGSSRSAYSYKLPLDSTRSVTSLDSNWVIQYRGDPDFHARRYLTHNTMYGLGCLRAPHLPRPMEPFRGREQWMHRTKQYEAPENPFSRKHNLFHPGCEDYDTKCLPFEKL